VSTADAVFAPIVHKEAVERVAFSPNGSRLVTTAKNGTARVWNATTGKPLTAPLEHGQGISWAAFSPDGSRLATVGAGRTARVWDAATGRLLIGPLAHLQPVLFASFSRDGKHLVTCGGDFDTHKGEIRIWDLKSARPTSRTFSPTMVISWAYLTPDGEHVVAAGGRRSAYLWSLATSKTDSAGVSAVRLDPESAVGPDPGRVLKLEGSTAQVYDVTTGKPTSQPLLHGGAMVLAVFSPDGQLVATAARDRTARVWDAVSGKPLTPPLRHGRLVRRAAFNADGRRLLTVSEDGLVRVWDLGSRELMQPLAPVGGAGLTALSPDGRLVVVRDRNGALWVRDAASDKVLHGPWKLAHPITDVNFAPDGRKVLAASDSGGRIWDAVTGMAVTPVLVHTGTVQRVSFTPDGSRAVILGPKDQLEVYDALTGVLQSSHALPGKQPLGGPTLTPDGRAVVVVKRTGQSVEIRDAVSGSLQSGPFRHAGLVTATAISPEGSRLAVATADGTAFLWAVATARLMAPPLQHGQPIRHIAFSGDGRRLVTAAEDHTARAWDVQTGLPVTPLLAYAEPIALASLAPDAHRLVVRGQNGAGAVWDLSPDVRPVDDLLRLTRVLSGQTLDARSGGFEPMEPVSLREAWPLLRTSFPREFGSSP
jgi:WD40 repeat protein